MRTRRCSRSLALAIVLCSVSAAAQQQQPALPPNTTAEARDRFQRGVDLFEERNYEAAMAEFLRAYELTRNPLVLFNISATHEITGHFVEALDAMLQYEREAPRDVVARRRAEIDTVLGRLRGRIGTIVVRFDAPGLEVRVDALVRATTEARTGLRVPAGRHRVRLTAPHFQPREEEFDIAGGTTLVVSEPLTPERAYMAVDCNVPGAEIVVDGRPVANTPTTSPLPVSEGSHHVIIRRPGYTTYETDVNSVGAGARVRAQLSWADPMPRDVGARMVVQASEPNAVAQIDGRRVNSDGSDLLPPGPHRLRVEREDFLPYEQDIDLAAGRENTISARLQPTPAYRERYMSSVRRGRAAGLITMGAGLLIAGGGLAWFVLHTPTLQGAQDAYDANEAALAACPMNPACDRGNLNIRRTNLGNDLDAENLIRYATIGVMGVGGAVTVVGLVLLLTAPSSSRFERQARGEARWQLQAGWNSVGLRVAF